MNNLIKKIQIYFFYLININLAFASNLDNQKEAEDEHFQAAYSLYNKEEWSQALQEFKLVKSSKLKAEAQKLCGDICFMEKGEAHSLKEAALYYLLSAHGCNPSVFNYIEASVPGIFKLSRKMQFEKLVNFWVNDATNRNISRISPSLLNEYLSKKYVNKLDYNKTRKVKMPYFFHKALIFLLNTHMFNEEDTSEIKNKLKEDQGTAYKIPMSCRMQEECIYKKDFIATCEPWIYGPVYPSIWRNENESTNSQPTSKTLSILYKYLLDSIYNSTWYYNSSYLSQKTHMDLPWILAGIQFYHHLREYDEPLSKSFSNDELIEELRKVIKEDKVLDKKIEDEFHNVVLKIETKNIFPDKQLFRNMTNKRREMINKINNEFQENCILFFASNYNYKNDLIKDIFEKFKHNLKKVELSCSKLEDIEVMKIPVMLFYIKELIIKNIDLSEENLKYIKNILRYHFHLEKIKLYINKTSIFSNIELYDKYKKAFDALEERKVKVEPYPI